MRYQISGKQIDIGEALQTYVSTEIGALMEKYSQSPTEAVVVFSRDAYEFVSEAAVHLPSGLTIQAKGASAGEIYAAFAAALERMEKQLRRYRRRLKEHRRSQPVVFDGGASYILAANDEPEAVEPDTLQPMIIAEMEARIPSVSVGEAVMQMELVGAPLLVFRNEGHGGVNVVYRRDDGNIGWIDPRNAR
jgi:ribosomal subunit interface protein